MASQEEDNKLVCNSDVNKDQERNFGTVYKKYEFILNNKSESFEKKIQSLIEVWRNVGELQLEHYDVRHVVQIMDWAKLHALNIVLTAEWKDYKAKYKTRLLSEIEKAQTELEKFKSCFAQRCQKLAKVVNNPWEDATLERLLSSKDSHIGPEEIEFFCVETAYLVSVRLKKLCESQCEDLALNLVTAFMKCNQMSKTQNFSLNATETQMWFIFDIYIALLYKFQENQKIVTLLKELSLDEGLQLIRRFAKKRVKISKIWRHCHRIAILASQVFLSTAAVKSSDENRTVLADLVESFINVCSTDALLENFSNSLRRISQLADAAGLYVFCDVIHRKVGAKLKPFTIEMYIRALTADMNNLERQKNDNEALKVVEISNKLAYAFCKLAELLDDHVNVARECVLTAFSLEPTVERLELIKTYAKRSGFEVHDTGQEWKCKKHPPVLPSDDLAWKCPDCDDWMCAPQLNIKMNTNTALFEALQTNDLGISPQLRDDLVVCLSNPRYQVLSWLLDWDNLQRLCVMYVNDQEGTKNIVTELKFVDIDYNMFKGIKREPIDEYSGIERGYEQYLDLDFQSDDQLSTISEDSASQESAPYSLGSDGAGDLAGAKPKSDPDTLKSLRMFRPSLKRPKGAVPQQKSKVLKTEERPTTSTHVESPQLIQNSKNVLSATLPHQPAGGQVAVEPKSSISSTITTSALLRKSIAKRISARNWFLGYKPEGAARNIHKLDTRTIMDCLSPCLQTTTASSTVTSNTLSIRTPDPRGTALLHNNRIPTTTIGSEGRTVIKVCGTIEPLFGDLNLNSLRLPSVKSEKVEERAASGDCSEGNLVQERIPNNTSMLSQVDNNDHNNITTLKSVESKSCNTFKGISVQDIINKSIDVCSTKCSDQTYLYDLLPQPAAVSKRTNSSDLNNECDKNVLPKIVCLTELNNEKDRNVKDCNLLTDDNVKSVNINDLVMNEHSFSKCGRQLVVVLNKLNVHELSKVRERKEKKSKAKTGTRKHLKRKCLDVRSENRRKKKRSVKKKISSPLQDRNPRVPSRIHNLDCDYKKDNKLPDNMNPRVVLERLSPSNRDYVKAVLANVPGLNDYQMMLPNRNDHIVNVVQISTGGRQTTNVQAQNTQTSTQVSPHIQRIGQPRSTEKAEQTTSSDSTTTTSTPTTTKPTTTQSSALINILSQQIIRPGQSNCVRTRPSPLINILSQQIIRPTTAAQKATTEQVNNSTKCQASEATTTTNQNIVKNSTTTTTLKTTQSSGQGTILQFICKSTLPKFQQAFGKTTVYNTENTEASTTTNETTTIVDPKKAPTKNIPVNVQPIQGGVIYTRQMPVGQAINLIPPGRGQVFRIATSNNEQISLVKDTVIHSKMSALLAAALQGKQKNSEAQSEGGDSSNEDGTTSTRVTVARPTLVQNARIVKPVLQIPSNVIRTSPQSNLSSTTLEQLREFDMVYKQIKERSSTSTPSETNSTTVESNEQSPQQQRISVTYVNQGQKYTQISPVVVVSSYCNLQPAASPALSVTSQGSSSPCVTPAPTPSSVPKVTSKSSKGKTLKSTTTHTSKSSPIPKPQQKPQEDEHTTQRIFDILAEYAEQLRNSPDLNNKPAPRRRSNPPTNPNQNSKRKKGSSSKKSGQCSSMVSDADTEDQRTMGSEDSSCGVVQLSVQDDEQPQIQSSITTESNDSSSNSRQLILTESGNNQTRNLIIADSSVGEALKMPNTAVLVPGNYIMPVSMVKGGQQIAVVSGGSKILATVPARSGPNMLLFQSFLNQNRKTGVPTVKYSTIQPLSGISSQSLAGVSAQPPVILPPNSQHLTAVTLGQPITLKKVDDGEQRVNTELLLTIAQPRDASSTKTSVDTIAQPDSSTNIASEKIEETVIQDNSTTDKVFQTYQKSIIATPIATPVIAQTAAIKEEADENVSQNLISINIPTDKDEMKVNERVQSVLVTACTSNGPMLSHAPPRYRKPEIVANNEVVIKEELLHNGEKQNNNEQKHFQGNTVYYTNKAKKSSTTPQRLDRELHQLSLQRKQAVLERELHLQKSLSEECEDLGVDEPSTSDLFPEAELLFDSNHSPSFDQSSQDLVKRPTITASAIQTANNVQQQNEIKDEKTTTMTLFSDDENSSSLRTDLFEYVEYTNETDIDYEQNQQLTNGQSSSTSNESGSSCEDNTLLQNCASMSDVTINSPVSPDLYAANTPPSLHKYKIKYSNKKKSERIKQQTDNWNEVEVSSSEDTTGSTELGKSASDSPEPCSNKRTHSISCDDELSDGSSYKVVRVAISKTDLLKDDESCEEMMHCEDDLDNSPNNRRARRSVKKLCSCCNGSQDEGAASRKRPNSRPHTPSPHKKAFLNKKR